MLRNKAWIYLFLGVFTLSVSAQENPEPNKRWDHYFSFQANKLLDEIVNFDASSSNALNPYVFSYELRNSMTQKGVSFGLGYSGLNSKDDDDIENVNNDLALRLGWVSYFKLAKRFESSFGLFALYGNATSETASFDVSEFGGQKDSVFFSTKSLNQSFGLMGRFNVNFLMSKRLLLGTEISFNVLRAIDKFNSEQKVYNYNNAGELNSVNTQVFNSKDISLQRFTLLPTTIYLRFRLNS